MAAGKIVSQVKLPAGAGKSLRRYRCLRFPRVTGGNLPAPAGNSHEVFKKKHRVIKKNAERFLLGKIFLKFRKSSFPEKE